jgi:hypothetical protein
MQTTTHHAYPHLLFDGGCLARTTWQGRCLSEAVAYRISTDAEAIVLAVTCDGECLTGLAPGGLAA